MTQNLYILEYVKRHASQHNLWIIHIHIHHVCPILNANVSYGHIIKEKRRNCLVTYKGKPQHILVNYKVWNSYKIHSTVNGQNHYTQQYGFSICRRFLFKIVCLFRNKILKRNIFGNTSCTKRQYGRQLCTKWQPWCLSFSIFVSK